MSEEIIIINDEPFYKIPNGTSYDYAPIPKEFKPYFERLQQENEQLKNNWNELKKWLEEYLDGARSGLDSYDCGIGDCLDDVLKKIQELEGSNE